MGKRQFAQKKTQKYFTGANKAACLHEQLSQSFQGGTTRPHLDSSYTDDDENFPMELDNYDGLGYRGPPISVPNVTTTSEVLPSDTSNLLRKLLMTEEEDVDEPDAIAEYLIAYPLGTDHLPLTTFSQLESTIPQFTTTDTAMVDLIDYCTQAGTPVKFLDKFLLILKRHVPVRIIRAS